MVWGLAGVSRVQTSHEASSRETLDLRSAAKGCEELLHKVQPNNKCWVCVPNAEQVLRVHYDIETTTMAFLYICWKATRLLPHEQPQTNKEQCKY
jgi:hypothetical protein